MTLYTHVIECTKPWCSFKELYDIDFDFHLFRYFNMCPICGAQITRNEYHPKY